MPVLTEWTTLEWETVTNSQCYQPPSEQNVRGRSVEAGVFPQMANNFLFLLVPGLVKKFRCLTWRQDVTVLTAASPAATPSSSYLFKTFLSTQGFKFFLYFPKSGTFNSTQISTRVILETVQGYFKCRTEVTSDFENNLNLFLQTALEKAESSIWDFGNLSKHMLLLL